MLTHTSIEIQCFQTIFGDSHGSTLMALPPIREAANCGGGNLSSNDGAWGMSPGSTTYCLNFSKLLNLCVFQFPSL